MLLMVLAPFWFGLCCRRTASACTFTTLKMFFAPETLLFSFPFTYHLLGLWITRILPFPSVEPLENQILARLFPSLLMLLDFSSFSSHSYLFLV